MYICTSVYHRQEFNAGQNHTSRLQRQTCFDLARASLLETGGQAFCLRKASRICSIVSFIRSADRGRELVCLQETQKYDLPHSPPFRKACIAAPSNSYDSIPMHMYIHTYTHTDIHYIHVSYVCTYIYICIYIERHMYIYIYNM